VVGCDTSNCGACTVLLTGADGVPRAIKSCSVLAVQADGCAVTTVEGLAAADGTLRWYKHAGYETGGGLETWELQDAGYRIVGNGWREMQHVFAMCYL
jgi:hypothetical protein